jgi:Calcineurin-like phosphoesterase
MIVIPASALTLTKFAVVGDIGCKARSITNLENIADSKLPFIGIGDYMYNCAPGDDVSGKRLGDLYADIQHKIGAKGNHDLTQQAKWAQEVFQYGDTGVKAWKLGKVGIIVMNPYINFKKGSGQYEFIQNKSSFFENNNRIDWIIYVVHEPFYSPAVTGGHDANAEMQKVYAPLIKGHNGFLIQAHNHVTAFGTVDGINQILCGGGGHGGDVIGNLNGFAWGTSKAFGYCELSFNDNIVTAKFIDTSKNRVKEYIFTR